MGAADSLLIAELGDIPVVNDMEEVPGKERVRDATVKEENLEESGKERVKTEEERPFEYHILGDTERPPPLR